MTANFKIYVSSDLNNLGKPLYHWRSPRDEKWYPLDINIGFHTQNDFKWIPFLQKEKKKIKNR